MSSNNFVNDCIDDFKQHINELHKSIQRLDDIRDEDFIYTKSDNTTYGKEFFMSVYKKNLKNLEDAIQALKN